MARMKPLSGTLWVERRKTTTSPTMDLYDPNVPNAWAILEIVGGKPHLSYAENAPRAFRTEVQKHLDKLKTLLILGGPT